MKQLAAVLTGFFLLGTVVVFGGFPAFAEEEAPAPEQTEAAQSDVLQTEAEETKAPEDEIQTASQDDAAVQEMKKSSGMQKSGEGQGQDVSGHFHAAITCSRDTCTSGETVIVRVKYTIDEGAASPGDYVIVTLPEDVAKNVRFSVSRQHFSSVEDIGGGRYKLVFGEDAATALSGSMSLYMTMQSEETTQATVTAGDGEVTITVLGGGSGESGTGTFQDEAIMKDGLGNEGMSYGGYDYSDGQGTQIGIFDAGQDNVFTYRLFVNRKNVAMKDVTVTDTLPDGMEFTGGTQAVKLWRMDPVSMSATDTPVTPQSLRISGSRLVISLGDIDCPVEIEYTVLVPAQTSVHLRNRSEITYTQDGKTFQEHQDYIAQSSDYAAANGIKSVDKTEVSEDPADQWVTYSIRFWNENGFEAGEISLTDDLDDYVDFLYADDSDLFSVKQDAEDPGKIHITNTAAIPKSTEVSVSFVCGFSRVPLGYVVENTVGGNTTRTKKVGGSVLLQAVKTVDGEEPGADREFTFRLMNENRRVLQTRKNGADGTAEFGRLYYGKEDLGKTFAYYIAEDASEDDRYTFDEAEYKVTVHVAEEADEDGTIGTEKTVTLEGEETDRIVFDNKTRENPTEPSSENPTEPSSENPTEPSSDRPTEPSSDKPTEPSSENPTEPSVTVPSSAAPTQPSAAAASSAGPTEPSSSGQSPAEEQGDRDESPGTGDSSRTVLLSLIMGASLFAMIAMTFIYGRKRHH